MGMSRLPDEDVKARVESATVRVLKLEGQGVLVPGELILTAAHCIGWSSEGGMALGDDYIEEIRTASGKVLKVQPWAVEPVLDIAVLGRLDNQRFPEEKESDTFDQFCKSVTPVTMCVSEPDEHSSFPINIYTHNGEWLSGVAELIGSDAASLWTRTNEQVEGGTSGGPIVNDVGELVGIASVFSDGESEGSQPWPCALCRHG